MTLEDRELVKARAWRMSAPDLAVEYVRLIQAFFGNEADSKDIQSILIHRGLSVVEASAVANRYETLTGEIKNK